jgi:pyruvate formate lyase activating enzyme
MSRAESSGLTAVVNRIIPFSSVDGPGNRTAVFLQGCNIDCKYCHNPETRHLCMKCGTCVSKCPAGALSRDADGQICYDASRCVQCDTCIHVCPHSSSPRTFRMTAEQIWQSVRRQIPFIRGLTVSGGECMLQPEFLTELFRLAKTEGLNTMIDSNGTIPFQSYPELLEVTDGVMLDIKAFDDADHRNVTGHTNQTVLENAAYLAGKGRLFEVRCVIVPDLYDPEKSVRALADWLDQVPGAHASRIKLIAYRPMGVRPEYAQFQVPSQELLQSLAGLFRQKGFEDIILI